ncbi:cystatin-M-like [Protopterus annectens]|uniref:cystatin-M-like n=1 Tax=Protopterus annectens TaxID=7888 RepID=UPI001CFB72F4|nr:cystatin-M-like [Protopterus annectens]
MQQEGSYRRSRFMQQSLIMIHWWLWICLCFSTSVLSDPPKLVGAPKDVDPNNPKVKQMAAFALGEYNKASKNGCTYEINNIIKAQEQIVAGVKYILTVAMKVKTCKKTETLKVQRKKKLLKCTFEVLEQAWRNSTQMLKSKCH